MRKLIEIGTNFLKENSIEEPRKNAEVLLSHILNKPLYYIYTADIYPSKKVIGTYNKLLIKRANGTPLQYLTKTVNFYGYNFFIERGVFIPRPETEMLVEKVIGIYKRYFSPACIKILDIGTGCGNIGITIAREIQNCKVVATDISKKAIKIASYNAQLHKVKGRMEFLKVNIFPPQKKKFHIIVSNPPYIPYSEKSYLDREVLREPFIALFAGNDGLNIIKKIIENSERFLQDRGFLLLEIGNKQGQYIKKIGSSLELISVEKDLAGIERVVIFEKRKG
ncbi:MAG: peptide chain release factor N(5)-glutamine methyltransferase [Candidatus Omnitrophica bacterium]|nr:peptide chain release factor N(5)-glutamine methyltransferase [Candidatus Omnitrophota bacterium]